MMSHFKFKFLAGTVLAALLCGAPVFHAYAEDCTGVLPGSDCDLDEDTTAPLTIDNGVTLYTTGSVTLQHSVNGSAVSGDGTISTADGGAGGDTVRQTADIGNNVAIDELVIDQDDTWVTSAAINTDNLGSDINLGTGDGGETLQILSGSTILGEIDGHSGDLVDFGADGNGGTFNSVTQIEGVNVVLTSGNLIVDGTMGGGVPLGGLTVSDGTSMTLNASATVDASATLDVDGYLRINSGRTLSTGNYSDADGDAGYFVVGVDVFEGDADAGGLDISSGVIDFSQDTLEIVIDDSSEPLTAGTIESIISASGGLTALPNFVDSSYMYNFSLVQDGTDIDLLVSVNGLDEITNSPNNEAIARVLFEDFAFTVDDAINQIQSLLGNDPTREAYNERLESLTPAMDGGFVDVLNNMTDQMQNSIHSRTRSHPFFRQAVHENYSNDEVVFVAGKQNLETGKTEKYDVNKTGGYEKNIWMRPFFTQGGKEHDDVDGNTVKTSGVIFGADMPDLDNNTLLGVSVLYGRGIADSDESNSTQTDVENFGFSVYGGRKIMKNTLLSAILSYVYGNNDVSRHNVAGIYANNARAKFKSEQITLQSSISRYYALANRMYVEPSAGVKYSYVSADPYTEKDIGNMGLDVGYSSINELSSILGARVGKLYKFDNGLIVAPEAHASYEYFWIADRLQSSTVLSEADTESADGQPIHFVLFGNDPSEHQFTTGMDLQMQKDDKLSFDASYLYGFNGYESNHAIAAKVVYGL